MPFEAYYTRSESTFWHFIPERSPGGPQKFTTIPWKVATLALLHALQFRLVRNRCDLANDTPHCFGRWKKFVVPTNSGVSSINRFRDLRVSLLVNGVCMCVFVCARKRDMACISKEMQKWCTVRPEYDQKFREILAICLLAFCSISKIMKTGPGRTGNKLGLLNWFRKVYLPDMVALLKRQTAIWNGCISSPLFRECCQLPQTVSRYTSETSRNKLMRCEHNDSSDLPPPRC